MGEIGGNPSRCDGCPVFEHCESVCEGCEDKTLGKCVNGCPLDCGALDQGPDPDDEEAPIPQNPGDREYEPDSIDSGENDDWGDRDED